MIEAINPKKPLKRLPKPNKNWKEKTKEIKEYLRFKGRLSLEELNDYV